MKTVLTTSECCQFAYHWSKSVTNVRQVGKEQNWDLYFASVFVSKYKGTWVDFGQEDSGLFLSNMEPFNPTKDHAKVGKYMFQYLENSALLIAIENDPAIRLSTKIKFRAFIIPYLLNCRAIVDKHYSNVADWAETDAKQPEGPPHATFSSKRTKEQQLTFELKLYDSN